MFCLRLFSPITPVNLWASPFFSWTVFVLGRGRVELAGFISYPSLPFEINLFRDKQSFLGLGRGGEAFPHLKPVGAGFLFFPSVR